MKFHSIINDGPRAFCGPGAVCIVTGWPTSVVVKAFQLNRRITGNCLLPTRHGTYRQPATQRIKGTTPHEVARVLEVFGYKMRGAKADSAKNTVRRLSAQGRIAASQTRPTTRQWMRARQKRDAMYLVITSNHWMLVKGNKWMDQMCSEPRSITSSRLTRGRVRAVYRITAPRDATRPRYRPGTQRTAKLTVNGGLHIA